MSDEDPIEEPDSAQATAEELLSNPPPGDEETARKQAEQILAESEQRTEDPSTVDPDDESIERRRAEDIAE